MNHLFVDVFFYGMVRSTLRNTTTSMFRGINRVVHEYARRTDVFRSAFDEVHWFGSRLPYLTRANFLAAGIDLLEVPDAPMPREIWLDRLNQWKPRSPWLRKLQAGLRLPIRYGTMNDFYVPVPPSKNDIWLSTCTHLTHHVRSLGVKRVVLCHDMNHIFHYRELGLTKPDTHPIANLALTLQPDEWAICISEYTRKCLLEYHPRLAPERTFVIPLGADLAAHQPSASPTEILQRYRISPQRYFLTLAAGGPHKNSRFIIEEFTTWHHAATQHQDVKLVLAGLGQDQLLPTLSEAALELVHKGNILFTGFVPDEDLPTLYGNSLAFVFASLAEGFGLPPLEAMLHGCPVLCSDRTSLPEVVGDAGVLFDPQQKGVLVPHFSRLIEQPDWRQTLAEKAKARAPLFTWDRSTKAIVEALQTIAAAPN